MSTELGLDAKTLALLREIVVHRWFAGKPESFWDSDDGKFLVEQQTSLRYLGALNHVVPWVDDAIGLGGRKVVEIGSGTGSSAAAFASCADEVHGLEIQQLAVDVAAERFRILGVKNAETRCVAAEDINAWIRKMVGGDCVVLLYAALEHMTVAERLATLRDIWQLLDSGGVIVIVETPNRLSYTDRHTSWLPFFNMLPLELCELYFQRSPRTEFVRQVSAAVDRSMSLQRWGRGMSYHELEIALDCDNLSDMIVRDGYEKLITDLYPLRPEDQILLKFFEQSGIQKSRAFTRYELNLVLRKP